MHHRRRTRRRSSAFVTAVLLVASDSGLAHEQSPATRAIEYRQSVYHVIG